MFMHKKYIYKVKPTQNIKLTIGYVYLASMAKEGGVENLKGNICLKYTIWYKEYT